MNDDIQVEAKQDANALANVFADFKKNMAGNTEVPAVEQVIDTEPDEEIVEDAPEPVEAPKEPVSDALLEALLKDVPKERTVDDEWADVAKTLKADVKDIQKEAVSALKRLVNPDIAERKAALADLAHTVGIDLSGDTLPRSDVDKAQIDALRAELATLKGHQVEAAKAKAEAEVKAFAEKHEDLDKYRPDMAKLIQAGIATDVKDAYKKAKALAGTAPTNIKHVKPSGNAKPVAPSKPVVTTGNAVADLAALKAELHRALRSK